MDDRQVRRAKNESLFRAVNERIEEFEQQSAWDGRGEFVCECDELECSERIEMTLEEYEELRADATTFAVVPGHDSPDVEDVVHHRDGYDVVRKRPGEPARVAAEDAPR